MSSSPEVWTRRPCPNNRLRWTLGQGKSMMGIKGKAQKTRKTSLRATRVCNHGHMPQSQKGRPRQCITAWRDPAANSSSPRAQKVAVVIWEGKPLSKDMVPCISTLPPVSAKVLKKKKRKYWNNLRTSKVLGFCAGRGARTQGPLLLQTGHGRSSSLAPLYRRWAAL